MRSLGWPTRTGAANAPFARLASGARSALPALSMHTEFGRHKGDTFTPGDLGASDV